MANFIKSYFGSTPSAAPVSEDADFADFADYAGVPDPSPAPISPTLNAPTAPRAAHPTSTSDIIYTRWYRIWERTSPKDFYSEAVIIPFIILVISIHVWGRRTNRRKARQWLEAHGPVLEQEFALVGFTGQKSPSLDDVQGSGLAKAVIESDRDIPHDYLKETSAHEFITYATGRQNVAFVDVKLSLYKRHNPVSMLIELILSFFFETARSPTERMEATAYAFDGREKDLVLSHAKPEQSGTDSRAKDAPSTYDGFVWAVVHKEGMRHLREDRYDLSLTGTKDNAKLPSWATVMSESAEITDALLTVDLIKAIEAGGDSLEYLIITDQPIDKPQKLNDTTPRKRLSLSFRLPSSHSDYERNLLIFSQFLRLPDFLVSNAHFRAEVQRKLRATREGEIRKLQKVGETEKAEERKLESDKKKKEIRDTRLKGMSADEQRKYLEREREKGNKKQEKKMSRKA